LERAPSIMNFLGGLFALIAAIIGAIYFTKPTIIRELYPVVIPVSSEPAVHEVANKEAGNKTFGRPEQKIRGDVVTYSNQSATNSVPPRVIDWQPATVDSPRTKTLPSSQATTVSIDPSVIVWPPANEQPKQQSIQWNNTSNSASKAVIVFNEQQSGMSKDGIQVQSQSQAYSDARIIFNQSQSQSQSQTGTGRQSQSAVIIFDKP
jgi:hypothetical protein